MLLGHADWPGPPHESGWRYPTVVRLPCFQLPFPGASEQPSLEPRSASVHSMVNRRGERVSTVSGPLRRFALSGREVYPSAGLGASRAVGTCRRSEPLVPLTGCADDPRRSADPRCRLPDPILPQAFGGMFFLMAVLCLAAGFAHRLGTSKWPIALRQHAQMQAARRKLAQCAARLLIAAGWICCGAARGDAFPAKHYEHRLIFWIDPPSDRTCLNSAAS